LGGERGVPAGFLRSPSRAWPRSPRYAALPSLRDWALAASSCMRPAGAGRGRRAGAVVDRNAYVLHAFVPLTNVGGLSPWVGEMGRPVTRKPSVISMKTLMRMW